MKKSDSKIRVIITGATSHIAKGLIYRFLRTHQYELVLFTRRPVTLATFLSKHNLNEYSSYQIMDGYARFTDTKGDVIINCIGPGTYKKHNGNFRSYFFITEKYDNMIIDYLSHHRETLYISLSSGAVYGNGFSSPITYNSCLRINPDHIQLEESLSITRLNSEAKHRACSNLKIIDLRIFSYFSRFLDIHDGYFLSEIIRSIMGENVLKIDSNEFIRDYLHPDDLFTAVLQSIHYPDALNTAVDVTSLKPSTKSEIIQYFSEEYGLQIEMDKDFTYRSATGNKHYYFSEKKKDNPIAYRPRYTSLETIIQETHYLMTDQEKFQETIRK